MAPHPIIYNSPVPNGHPTIVIDTGAQAMQQGGYLDTYQEAAAGQPVMGQRGGRQTPRNRTSSPRRGMNPGVSGPSKETTSKTVVTVRKLN